MAYRSAASYRTSARYRLAPPPAAPPYRKGQPYRKPRSYRGLEDVPAAGPPSTSSVVAAPFGPGLAQGAPKAGPWRQPEAHALAAGVAWDPPAPLDVGHATAWRLPTPRGIAEAVCWSPAPAAAPALVRAPWALLPAQLGPMASAWSAGVPVAAPAAASWRLPQPRAQTRGAAWQPLHAQHARIVALWRALAKRNAVVAAPWGPLGRRSSDVDVDWPVQPDPHPDTLTVPYLPVYAMLPSITLVRLPDRTPLNVINLELQADLGSWAWSFSAQVARADLALVDPAAGTGPVTVEANVNGYVWNLLVEAYDDNARFGARTLTLRGRSPSALLAAPYAPARTFTEGSSRTIAQLAEQELAGTDWSLSWDAVGWTVAAGTFSYQDLTPIDAIGRLASAIGAAVLTAPATEDLVVQPTYPISPWEWPDATPYAFLQASLLASADGSWRGGPNANGIYVYSGGGSGYGALVKITGSDGARQLPMVVEQLTDSADPARERGRHELARASQIKTETRTVPLFPSPAPPGLLPLGSLLEIADGEGAENTWRGQLMGLRVSAQRSGRGVTVRQVLSLERHFRA